MYSVKAPTETIAPGRPTGTEAEWLSEHIAEIEVFYPWNFKQFVPVGDAAATLAKACRGAVLRYWRGELARDRDAAESQLPQPKQQYLDALATELWKLAEVERCCLTQFRHRSGDFSYFVIPASQRL